MRIPTRHEDHFYLIVLVLVDIGIYRSNLNMCFILYMAGKFNIIEYIREKERDRERVCVCVLKRESEFVCVRKNI